MSQRVQLDSHCLPINHLDRYFCKMADFEPIARVFGSRWPSDLSGCKIDDSACTHRFSAALGFTVELFKLLVANPFAKN